MVPEGGDAHAARRPGGVQGEEMEYIRVVLLKRTRDGIFGDVKSNPKRLRGLAMM